MDDDNGMIDYWIDGDDWMDGYIWKLATGHAGRGRTQTVGAPARDGRQTVEE